MRSRRPTERWPCSCTLTSVKRMGPRRRSRKSERLTPNCSMDSCPVGRLWSLLRKCRRNSGSRPGARWPNNATGQNPGPNAHNEKPVPKEVPKEWLFEVNAPDIGNVSTNDEHFEQRDDGRVLSGECMKNRHAAGEASTDKARVQGSNGTNAATSNGSQAQQADREFEGLGDTDGFGGFGIAGMLHEWLMPNLSLTFLGPRKVKLRLGISHSCSLRLLHQQV